MTFSGRIEDDLIAQCLVCRSQEGVIDRKKGELRGDHRGKVASGHRIINQQQWHGNQTRELQTARYTNSLAALTLSGAQAEYTDFVLDAVDSDITCVGELRGDPKSNWSSPTDLNSCIAHMLFTA